MTIKQFSEMINGRLKDNELSISEEIQAKDLGYIVVYGTNSNITKLRGTITEKIEVYNNNDKFYFTNKLTLLKQKSKIKKSYPVKVEHFNSSKPLKWRYNTLIPHEKFYVMDCDEVYCIGMIIDTNIQVL